MTREPDDATLPLLLLPLLLARLPTRLAGVSLAPEAEESMRLAHEGSWLCGARQMRFSAGPAPCAP